MLGHHLGLISIRQDVQQIAGRNEVEPRERQTFRLQVLGQRFLAEDQFLFEDVQGGREPFFIRRLNYVQRPPQLLRHLLEFLVYFVESLGVRGQLSAYILGRGEDALQMCPGSLHLEPDRDHLISDAQLSLPTGHLFQKMGYELGGDEILQLDLYGGDGYLIESVRWIWKVFTWFSSRVSISSSLALIKVAPVRA